MTIKKPRQMILTRLLIVAWVSVRQTFQRIVITSSAAAT